MFLQYKVPENAPFSHYSSYFVGNGIPQWPLCGKAVFANLMI